MLPCLPGAVLLQGDTCFFIALSSGQAVVPDSFVEVFGYTYSEFIALTEIELSRGQLLFGSQLVPVESRVVVPGHAYTLLVAIAEVVLSAGMFFVGGFAVHFDGFCRVCELE